MLTVFSSFRLAPINEISLFNLAWPLYSPGFSNWLCDVDSVTSQYLEMEMSYYMAAFMCTRLFFSPGCVMMLIMSFILSEDGDVILLARWHNDLWLDVVFIFFIVL